MICVMHLNFLDWQWRLVDTPSRRGELASHAQIQVGSKYQNKKKKKKNLQ